MSLWHRRGIFVGSFLATLLAAAAAAAEGPGKGELSKSNLVIGRCNVSQVRVRFDLDSHLGEPWYGAKYWWDGDKSCNLHYSTYLLLQVRADGVASRYVHVQPLQPKAQDWSHDLPNSPNWDKVLCRDFAKYTGVDCLDPKTAKELWKQGAVVDFVFKWDEAEVAAEIAREEAQRKRQEERERAQKEREEAKKKEAEKKEAEKKEAEKKEAEKKEAEKKKPQSAKDRGPKKAIRMTRRHRRRHRRRRRRRRRRRNRRRAARARPRLRLLAALPVSEVWHCWAVVVPNPRIPPRRMLMTARTIGIRGPL
jgi:flagellar biosynthesis GTPase FlhF